MIGVYALRARLVPISSAAAFRATVTFAAPVTGLKELTAVKPADVTVKTVDFPDLTDPKMMTTGAEPKSLPPVRE